MKHLTMYKVIITTYKGELVHETQPVTMNEVIEWLDVYRIKCDVIVIPEHEVSAW